MCIVQVGIFTVQYQVYNDQHAVSEALSAKTDEYFAAYHDATHVALYATIDCESSQDVCKQVLI